MTRLLIATLIVAGALAGCSAGDDNEPGDESGAAIPFDTSGWKTDFSRHSAPLQEFVGGGPPKDGIPSIDAPHDR